MKELFKGYYKLSEEDYKILWDNATFVFDTNIFLNLYRYQENTRKQLLKLLSKIKDRIWEPHHVMLEYQRERLNVIANQKNTFNEIKSFINDKYTEIELRFSQTIQDDRHNVLLPFCQALLKLDS